MVKITIKNKFYKIKLIINIWKIKIKIMRFHIKNKKSYKNLKGNLICKKVLKFQILIYINLRVKSVNGCRKEGNKKLIILI